MYVREGFFVQHGSAVDIILLFLYFDFLIAFSFYFSTLPIKQKESKAKVSSTHSKSHYTHLLIAHILGLMAT